MRRWVGSLESHLGNDFSPMTIVDKIVAASLTEATQLKHRIIGEFPEMFVVRRPSSNLCLILESPFGYEFHQVEEAVFKIRVSNSF